MSHSSIKYELYKVVNSIIVNRMSEFHIPGLAIEIVKNDSMVIKKGYGVQSIDEKDLFITKIAYGRPGRCSLSFW